MTEDIDWLTTSVLQAPGWRNIGPHRGGRVVAVAGDVRTPGQFYFGACAGGVWKTSDSGITWRNVSDGFFNTAAVGALAVSESDPNVIYAGTGETSIRNQVSHGDGVYRSTDGGRTWRHRGLSDTRHIGKIQIHPHDPDTVYVAALGHAFGPNSERGVFRSRDGGETWERVFHRSERSGTHDLAMDPNNPRILYAPSWQVRRYPHALDSGGEECGLHRSFDGGDTWEEISRRPGLPTGLLGKIGVAASRAQPGRVWALIEAEDGALFRSDDYGETWVRLSEQSTLRTRPWYYMHVTADPIDADTVYVQNYGIWKSTDAGATFEKLPSLHGDEHALWIHPADNRTMIKGDDGGGCVSHNGGVSWSTIHNQPTAQIYHVITDDQYPYRVYGSQQDNSAITLPSATDEVAIHERTWYAPGGGESGYIAIKPDEPWHVVASGPVGRRAYNDVMSHYDHRTGQPRNITVWPELFGWGAGAEAMRYRFQWTFPILFSPHAPHPLYVASNHLHRSDDLGTSFTVISPDLTRNDPEKLKASGGPITRDNTGAEVYCTIYALAESPQRQGVFWAGSDDGLVHLSQDGGETWQDITPPELPEWAMISIIELSPHRDGTAFVAATRYRLDDPAPYLFRTDDHGATWTLITSGIPGHEFTRVIREDPVQPNLLFAGTETGLYVSLEGGGEWERMGGGLPVVPVYDLAVKGDELVVATHGRSFWVLDDLTPLRELARNRGDAGTARLFPPRARVRGRRPELDPADARPRHVNYVNADTSAVLWDTVPGPDGEPTARLLTAGTNPPAGMVVTYAMPQEPVSEVSLSFHDASGAELRRFAHDDATGERRLPTAPGVHRFAWNLRSSGATSLTDVSLDTWERPDGPMVVPGEYEVRLRVDGQTTAQPFTVLPDPRVSASAADYTAQRDMLLEIVAALSRTNQTVIATERLRDGAREWLGRSSDPAITAAVRAVIDALDPLRPRLIDINIHQSQLWPSGLHEKFNALFESVDSADFAPPAQAREVFAKLTAELDDIVTALEGITREEVHRLNAALRQGGAAYVG